MKAKAKIKPSYSGFSFIPTAAPTQRATRRDGGRNDFEADFLHAADFILSEKAGFQLQDFFHLLAAKDIPNEEIKILFTLWSEEKIREGKIREIRGCYEVSTYECV